MSAGAYDNYPGFYELDNRKSRFFTPITKEHLEKKHAAMFAEWNLQDKTVLDLGSCLGATGQWVLFHGAKSYTGVEIQEDYIAPSRELLAHWDNKAQIIHSSLEDFLENNTQKFDVVVMLGVIYVYVNHYDILDKVSAICNECLVIEGYYPIPPMGNPTAPVVEIVAQHGMVSARGEKNLRGVGARISPMALEIIMGVLGFESVGTQPVPKHISESLDNFRGDPLKHYLVRYISIFKNSHTIRKSLADIMKTSDESGAVDWSDIEIPDGFLPPTEAEMPETAGTWEFDEDVAKRFESETAKHIPDYDRVIDMVIKLATRNCQIDVPVIDVGCARGETLKRLHDKGFRKLYGVDNSKAMLKLAYRPDKWPIQYIESETFPKEMNAFGFVIANWTLHFIQQRKAYLQSIYDGMLEGGLFMLTEKMQRSETIDALYKEFKIGNGVPAEEIRIKDESLKGVLVSYPLEWYLIVLREIGFRYVEVVNSRFSFITLFCKK